MSKKIIHFIFFVMCLSSMGWTQLHSSPHYNPGHKSYLGNSQLEQNSSDHKTNLNCNGLSATLSFYNLVPCENLGIAKSCSQSQIIVHSTIPNCTFQWFQKIGNSDVPLLPPSNDSVFFIDMSLNFDQTLFCRITDPITLCTFDSNPLLMIYADLNPVTINVNGSYNDTITFCKNYGPVKLNLSPDPYYSFIEQYDLLNGEGLYYDSISKCKYFYTDSVLPGYHTIKFDFANANLTCGNFESDSITFFIDTCEVSIITGVVAPSRHLCSGDLVNVPFNTNGVYDSSNIFKAMMGTTVLGTNSKSPITIVVPFGSSTMQVQIVSTSPADTGTLNYDGVIMLTQTIKPTITSQDINASCFKLGAELSPTTSVGFYRWYLNNNLVSNDENITVNQIGEYVVENYKIDGCSKFSDPVLILDSADVPTLDFTLLNDTNYLCLGDSASVLAMTESSNSYQWFRGKTFINNANDSIFYIKESKLPNYGCMVTALNGCTVSKQFSDPFYIQPSFGSGPIWNLDTIPICSTDSVIMLNASGSNHQWYKNDSILVGETNTTYLATESGNYKYSELLNTNCFGFSKIYKVSFKTTPIVNLNPPIARFFCSGDTPTISIENDSAFLFIWTYNIVESEQVNLSQIIATNSPSATVTLPGYYSIYKIDPVSGCYGKSSYHYQIEQSPDVNLVNIFPAYICNDSILIEVPLENNTSYLWNVNGIIDSTYISNEIYVSQPGSYFVQAQSIFGCKSISDTAFLYTGTTPQAIATALGNTTFCLGDSVALSAQVFPGYSYQWNYNQLAISGATYQLYQAKTPGIYTVMVTNADGCTSISTPIVVRVPCMPVGDDIEKIVTDENLSEQILIYPNPVDEILTIKVYAKFADQLQIELFDFSGRLSKSFRKKIVEGRNIFEISMRDLVSGMYSLKMDGNNFNKYFKIVKN